MTEPLTCPDPVHRLRNLIGEDVIAEWEEDAPSPSAALAAAALAMPCHLHRDAVRLMCEAGWFRNVTAAMADPCETIHALAITVLGLGE
jgi:hypothetical protein